MGNPAVAIAGKLKADSLALRAECEAMKLENGDIAYLRDTIMGITAGILASSSSGSPKNARCSVIKV